MCQTAGVILLARLRHQFRPGWYRQQLLKMIVVELCICHRGSLHIAAIKFCGPADDEIDCTVQN